MPVRRLAWSWAASSLLAGAALAQDPAPDDALARARAAEIRQVAIVEKVAPAVAAVFPSETPGGGGGSGVVIDPRGYVLTNFHVSETHRVLTVGLSDGNTYRARLIGIDPGGDIALLRLLGREDFPFVEMGESDAVRPGERVFAMGNPFLLAEDFAPTVTEGVVSGVHRYRDASGSSDLVYGDGIQIDASINPGNSGGPLFSHDGKLLGINGLGGFRPDRGRVNVGVGFAASIDQIKEFLLDLRAGKQCQHATMNATVRDQDVEGGGSRVIVDALTKDSGAHRAGLRLGDIVRAFEGVTITTQNQLLTYVSRLPAGRRVTLRVDRPREDGQGAHQVELSFRLEVLYSGPAEGEWVPEPDLVQQETQALLSRYRATKPAREWALEESVALPGGQIEARVLRARGRQVRLERGPPDARQVEVWDGTRGWRLLPTGASEPLPAARRDVLAGTADALAALIDEGQAPGVTLTFTGGEVLKGQGPGGAARRVAKIESRDRAGRRRLLYLDPETGALAGLCWQDEKQAWVEEAWTITGGALRVTRLDDATGAPRERTTEARLVPGPQDPALFAAPAAPGGG